MRENVIKDEARNDYHRGECQEVGLDCADSESGEDFYDQRIEPIEGEAEEPEDRDYCEESCESVFPDDRKKKESECGKDADVAVVIYSKHELRQDADGIDKVISPERGEEYREKVGG